MAPTKCILAAAAVILTLFAPVALAHKDVKVKYYYEEGCDGEYELESSGLRIHMGKKAPPCWGVVNDYLMMDWLAPGFRSYEYDWGTDGVRGVHKHDSCQIRAFAFPGFHDLKQPYDWRRHCGTDEAPVHVHEQANNAKGRKVCVNLPREAHGLKLFCHKA